MPYLMCLQELYVHRRPKDYCEGLPRPLSTTFLHKEFKNIFSELSHTKSPLLQGCCLVSKSLFCFLKALGEIQPQMFLLEIVHVSCFFTTLRNIT